MSERLSTNKENTLPEGWDPDLTDQERAELSAVLKQVME